MSSAPRFRREFRLPWRDRERIRDEVDEEIEFHLDMRTQALMREGLTPEEACAQARREFGDPAQAGRKLSEADEGQERRRRWAEWADGLQQDLAYAVRMLRRSPGFTLVAMLTLALGIGANTAIFSVIDGVLLRPLPYSEPGRLVGIRAGMGVLGEFLTVREQAESFEGVAAYNAYNDVSLTGEGEPARLESASISPNLFPLLGVSAAVGRTFRPGEDRAGRDRVVVLSHALWQQRFGSDPGVVGREVMLDGVSRTVVGVMPAGLGFPNQATDLWIPLTVDGMSRPDLWGTGGHPMIARVRPGVPLEQARSEVGGLESRMRELLPWAMPDDYWRNADVSPLREQLVADVKPLLLVLFGAVGILLLIACVNVANLLLARAMARRKEMAIRGALGAGRGRIARQLLTECVLLSLLGGGLGLLLAYGGGELLVAGLPADTPRLSEVGIDGRVLSFTLLLALLTGVFFGLLPSLRSAGRNVQATLRGGGRSGRGRERQRLSGALVATEIALAVVLVIGAGLLIRSFGELLRVDPGFQTSNIVAATVAPPEFRYDDDASRRAFYGKLLERLEALPGTRTAAVATSIPLGERNYGSVFVIEGRPDPATEGGDWPFSELRAFVTPGYFRALGVPLVRGTGFANADREGAPRVAVVNQSLARRFWPEEDPMGKRIRLPGEDDWRTVVGVVADVKQRGLSDQDQGAFYLPLSQGLTAGPMSVVLRSTAEPATAAASIRSVIASLDEDTPVSDVRTLEQLVSDSVERPRFAMLLLAAFAGVALLLGAVGIYGVIAHAVGQRTSEFAVRMAMGAQAGDVLRLVLRQGFALALGGIALGLAIAFAATRLLQSLLYGVGASDPLTFAAVPFLLAAVAILASVLPARRATRVEPAAVLRRE